jgi:hypothetical protein
LYSDDAQLVAFGGPDALLSGENGTIIVGAFHDMICILPFLANPCRLCALAALRCGW